MAGKGRGIAAFTFNIEALGLTRGSMPETQRGPTPLFPQIEYKPGPLKAGEDEDYMRALKQEMRGRMKDLPFNIKPHAGKGDTNRKAKISSKDKEELLNKLDENDYIANYFEDGDDYGGGSDDNMDEATY
ncbi:DNA-directed RNA polymerase III subunit RPC7-like protein [Labeo rohita]|uniref:DNA-directed RNA polymerase III subunit RPC7-like protein n=1 Tax=Labeo rohita TaxID=84645 RepID=A0A498MLU0_LABRO|nr:DNA-directed RNA polymerase III subunit RPC7-like protein [Labeo rohita]